MLGAGGSARLKFGPRRTGKWFVDRPFVVQVTPPHLRSPIRVAERYLQILLLVLTMLVTASSVYSLRSKRGLPLVNQALGWAVLGEIISSPFRHHQPLTMHFAFHSIRLTVPIRIPRPTPKPLLEDSLVLPRVLGLFCDTFYQCRRAIFPFVFSAVGRVG